MLTTFGPGFAGWLALGGLLGLTGAGIRVGMSSPDFGCLMKVFAWLFGLLATLIVAFVVSAIAIFVTINHQKFGSPSTSFWAEVRRQLIPGLSLLDMLPRGLVCLAFVAGWFLAKHSQRLSDVAEDQLAAPTSMLAFRVAQAWSGRLWLGLVIYGPLLAGEAVTGPAGILSLLLVVLLASLSWLGLRDRGLLWQLARSPHIRSSTKFFLHLLQGGSMLSAVAALVFLGRIGVGRTTAHFEPSYFIVAATTLIGAILCVIVFLPVVRAVRDLRASGRAPSDEESALAGVLGGRDGGEVPGLIMRSVKAAKWLRELGVLLAVTGIATLPAAFAWRWTGTVWLTVSLPVLVTYWRFYGRPSEVASRESQRHGQQPR